MTLTLSLRSLREKVSENWRVWVPVHCSMDPYGGVMRECDVTERNRGTGP